MFAEPLWSDTNAKLTGFGTLIQSAQTEKDAMLASRLRTVICQHDPFFCGKNSDMKILVKEFKHAIHLFSQMNKRHYNHQYSFAVAALQIVHVLQRLFVNNHYHEVKSSKFNFTPTHFFDMFIMGTVGSKTTLSKTDVRVPAILNDLMMNYLHIYKKTLKSKSSHITNQQKMEIKALVEIDQNLFNCMYQTFYYYFQQKHLSGSTSDLEYIIKLFLAELAGVYIRGSKT